MAYLWKVNMNGVVIRVEAQQPWTAVARCISKENTQGRIFYERLHKLKRITCDVCGGKYSDWDHAMLEHIKSWYHQKMLKEKAEN